jgi:hypothetical protein
MGDRRVLLGAIFVVGGLLRFWGIFHGLRDGFVYHQDAKIVVHFGWHHFLGASPVAGHFGVVYAALLRLAMEAADGLGRFVGYPVNWSFPLVAAVASVAAAIFGTATIGAVYVLAARAYGPGAGLWAAALFAVDPMHSFHSHYPYRDTPMLFFLVVGLVAAVLLAQRPTVGRVVAGTLAAMLAAALKTSGLAVVVALLAGSAIGVVRTRRVWVAVAAIAFVLAILIGVGLGGIPPLPGGELPRLSSPGAVVWSFGYFVIRYLRDFGSALPAGIVKGVWVLAQWLGWPLLAAIGVAVGYRAWRREAGDIVLLVFAACAFGVAVMFPWLDERYLLPVLPVGLAMLGSLLVAPWGLPRPTPALRAVAALAGLALVAGGLGQSAWQGVLLSLPDTRALAGRWLDAHVPRTARIAVEEYYPLGVQDWPNVSFLDLRQPFAGEAAKADLVVTSTLEHQRFLDEPARFPAEVAFLRELAQRASLVKRFALGYVGFIQPTIEIYSTAPPAAAAAMVSVPRPYERSGDDGVLFLDRGPYDRDDRTLILGGAQRYTATLAGEAPADEIVVIVQNASDPIRLTVRVGWDRRTRGLEAGEWRVLTFHPWRLSPKRPALYPLEVGILPEGTRAMVQVRSGDREIGEAYADWGRWEAAVPYLERAVATRPSDLGARLQLATAYRQLRRDGEAERALAPLAQTPAVLARVLALARSDPAERDWARAFHELTGLEPRLLTHALGEDVEAEALRDVEARRRPDGDASGGASLAFEKGPPASHGATLTWDDLYLPGGAYRAGVVLRGSAIDPGGPLAILHVFAEDRRLASRPIGQADLRAEPGYVDVWVPFVHTEPAARLAIAVEVTGRARLAVDKLRVEPDLPGLFRESLRRLPALAALSERAAAGPPKP